MVVNLWSEAAAAASSMAAVAEGQDSVDNDWIF